MRPRPLLALAVGVLLATNLFGQAQITTRREKLKDFATRITKVVLSGDPFYDEALKESVANHWSLSPCEFCSVRDFEALKTNPNLFFLLAVDGQSGKEEDPAIRLLTLVRGGEEAKEGIGKMLEVVSFPLCAAQNPSGREFALLPAILEIIQDHTATQTHTEMKAYSGLGVYNKNSSRLWNKRIHLSSEDLSPQVTRSVRMSLDEDIVIEDGDQVDEVFAKAAYNTVVSYVVAPSEPEEGDWCYKMLIGADDHKLYYYKKHRITGRNGAGFLESDVKALGRNRRK